jgi:hypothetical protein
MDKFWHGTGCHAVTPGGQRGRAASGDGVVGTHDADADHGHPARLWPSSPHLAAHVTIRRTLLSAPRSPGLGRKRAQAEVPSGLAASSAGAAGTATRKHMAAVPRITGRQPAGLGRQRHRRIRHTSAVYQQVSLSVTALA